MEPADAERWHELASRLADFARILSTEHTAADIANRLGDYCTDLLPVHGVGLLLRNPDGGLEIGTANTEAGQMVEGLEVDLGEGPCTDALGEAVQVPVPDLRAAADRYPRFTPPALATGVAAVHAFPLMVRGAPLGALDVISLEPVALDAGQLAMTQMLADVAIAYLVSSRALREKSRLAAQLQAALDSRVLIEQAKGKLAERHGIPVSAAFERLRRHARNTGTRLTAVVEAVLRDELDV